MSDIYEIKAKKYKYKYLKLKKQYISEGGAIGNCNLNNYLSKQDFKDLSINQIYIDPNYKSFFDIQTVNSYDQRILSNEDYDKYKINYNNISQYDKDHKFISKQIYVGKFIKKTSTIKNFLNINTKDENILKKYGCQLLKNNSVNEYIYIINSKLPSTLFTNKIKDKNSFITILTSIKNFIDTIIEPLYKDNYVFGNIKKENMTLDNNNNIYFIKNTIHMYNDANEIKKIGNEDNYPSIIRYFSQIKVDWGTNDIFKIDFRKFIYNIENNDLHEIFKKSIDELNTFFEEQKNNLNYNIIQIQKYGHFHIFKELKDDIDNFNIQIQYGLFHISFLDLKIQKYFTDFITANTQKYIIITNGIKETLIKKKSEKEIKDINEIVNKINNNNNIFIDKIRSIEQKLGIIFNEKKIIIDIYKELNNLLLNEYKLLGIKEVLKHLEPISKNSDIYAISKLIHDLLINLFIDNNTKKLIEELYDDAKYNKIKDPNALKERLEKIIN